jgi:hypothetical protein
VIFKDYDMRTTMKMQDLKKANGFPVDIDRSKPVVVVVGKKDGFDLVCYTNKDGDVTYYFTDVDDVRHIFAKGMYIIHPK